MSIVVSNLKFNYGNKVVLDDISFKTNSSELICMLGSNGAGKTTLIKCLLGNLQNYSGEIIINDHNIKEYSIKELSHILSYVPQNKSQQFSLNVIDVVMMGTAHNISLMSEPKDTEYELSINALSKLGIDKLANQPFDELSGGEQQLVLIARALAQQTKIILMDEPSSALDYANQHYIMSIVKQLTREGYLIILSTHNPEHALNYADKILAIKDGKIIFDDIAINAIDSTLIKNLYGIDTQILKSESYISINPILK